jgi:hypothetical protein
MRNCASGNLEIPGCLFEAPGMMVATGTFHFGLALAVRAC